MVIYSDTQHHQGIDLEGNDINKAKFPRIERNGLFVDEVRSNPTTGLLEIWDGTQWLGYIENDSLPSGTVNQTLRHDGTGWVANSTLEISDGVVTIPCIGYQGEIDYNRTVLFNYQSVQGYSFSDTAGGAFNLSHGLDNGGWGKLALSGQNGNYIVELSTLQDDYFFKGYNSSSNAEFVISSECVMRLSSLCGTTPALLEALPVGTVQRSAMPIVKAKIIDRVLTEDTFMFYYTSDDLGVEPDLRDKITSFEVYRKRAEQDFFSTGVATVIDKQLSYDSISFASNDGITAGDTVRVAVAYIDGIPGIPDTSVPNAPVMIGYNPDGFVVSWGMA